MNNSAATLILSGIPTSNFNLQNLAQHLDRALDSDEVGTFRLRKIKHQIAMDFNTSYDAMLAQGMLDGMSYTLEDGIMQVLRARLTRDPELMSQQRLPPVIMALPSQNEHSSSSHDDDDTDSKHLKNLDRKINDKLNHIRIKKHVLLTEEQLLFEERMKIRKELMELDSSLDNAKTSRMVKLKKSSKKKRKRTPISSETSSSDSELSPVKKPKLESSKKSKDSSESVKKIKELLPPRNFSAERLGHHRVTPRRDSYIHWREQEDRRRRERERSVDYARASSSRDVYAGHSRDLHSWSRNDRSSWRRRPRSPTANDYRPNVSEKYHRPPRHCDRSYQKSNQEKETLNVKSETVINVDKIELDAKKKQAIRDILLEVEKPLDKLTEEKNASDTDRKHALMKFLEIVKRRFKNLEVNNTMSVRQIIIMYRCDISKIEDEDLITEIFNNVMATKREQSATTSNLDSAIDEFDKLFEIKKEEVDEGEEEEGEIININIDIAPETESHIIVTTTTTTNRKLPDKELYVMTDETYGYEVKITLDRTRRKAFFIPVKKMLNKLKAEMKKYTDHIDIELFQFIMAMILEKRFREVLQGKTERLKYRDVFSSYREKYPIEDDEAFVLETLCAIWRGEFNDGRRIEDDVDLAIVKKEKDSDNTVTINIEKDSDNTVTIKKEKYSDNTVTIKKEKETELEVDIRKDVSKTSEDTKKENGSQDVVVQEIDIKTEDSNKTTVSTNAGSDNRFIRARATIDVAVKSEPEIPSEVHLSPDDVVAVDVKPEIIELSDDETSSAAVKPSPAKQLAAPRTNTNKPKDPFKRLRHEITLKVLDETIANLGVSDSIPQSGRCLLVSAMRKVICIRLTEIGHEGIKDDSELKHRYREIYPETEDFILYTRIQKKIAEKDTRRVRLDTDFKEYLQANVVELQKISAHQSNTNKPREIANTQGNDDDVCNALINVKEEIVDLSSDEESRSEYLQANVVELQKISAHQSNTNKPREIANTQGNDDNISNTVINVKEEIVDLSTDDEGKSANVKEDVTNRD